MKNFRRKLKKRSRVRTFEELEEAFYGLVQIHNILSASHRKLERDAVRLENRTDKLEWINTGYDGFIDHEDYE